MTHIYAFGSIVRGEIDEQSDIDLLAIVENRDNKFSLEKFSVYSISRLKELWKAGNPFAWHLHKESILLFSSDGSDAIGDLGTPLQYNNGLNDCVKFINLFESSKTALLEGSNSACFELSTIFLAVRNFATCYAMQALNEYVFSRNSALLLKEDSVPMTEQEFSTCMKARVLSTRGHGIPPSKLDIQNVIMQLDDVSNWMNRLLRKLK